jgi:hypothetical protein
MFHELDVEEVVVPDLEVTIPILFPTRRKKSSIDRMLRDWEILYPSGRNPPSHPYLDHLLELVSRNHGENTVPEWTEALQLEELGENACSLTLHTSDKIIANMDLTLFAYYLTTNEGRRTIEFLKKSWERVTLCEGSSIVKLYPGSNARFKVSAPRIIQLAHDMDITVAEARHLLYVNFKGISKNYAYHSNEE